MKSIKEVLMERDKLSEAEADAQIKHAQDDLYRRLERGEMPFDICAEHFGLEPDYIHELM